MNQQSKFCPDEFQEFVSLSSAEPPFRISENIINHVKHALNPSPVKVFAKLSLIHLVMGTITLLFCPQFGVSFFNSMGLMFIFMQLGPNVCMVACGALFLGTSMLTASIILRPEEIKILRRGAPLHIAILSTLSMGVLICTNAEIALGLGALWFLGSIIGGTSTLELGWMVRRHILLVKM